MTTFAPDALIVDIPVLELDETVNILKRPPWTAGPLDVSAIRHMAATGDTLAEEFSRSDFVDSGDLADWEFPEHHRRVAYLLANPDRTPISVEVYGGVHIHDGNHRLAAAVIRGDAAIPVELGGDLDEVLELFPSLTEADLGIDNWHDFG